MTKQLSKRVRDYERLNTNKRILIEHGKSADIVLQQLHKTLVEAATTKQILLERASRINK